ncbi:MAG: glutaminyl-peptide cyclotransferase [Gammaproteobacteria bacterium]|nr:glutaminyl-peptide cyclotransferase [Gammaproteobacteria bacterium]
MLTLVPGVALAAESASECGYRLVKEYPHDRGAFTQGLLFSHGMLYESTGLFGQSTLREVDLNSGRVLRKNRLPAEDFGEGLALVNDKLVQLTWTSGRGYVWDRGSFTLNGHMPFRYNSPHADGLHRPWGLCYDQQRLVLSNGTHVLHFLDAQDFSAIGSVAVHDENGPVALLNELECIGGKVFANVLRSEFIVVIDPLNGAVTARLDLAALHPAEQRKDPQNFLNGIAYNTEHNRLFVTGKRWPRLYEIELTDQCLTP